MKLILRYKWAYLYQVVNSLGNIIDFLLRDQRDLEAVKPFSKRILEKMSVQIK